jgi:PLP dependent protein
MSSRAEQIADNLARVRQTLTEAAKRSGRQADEVCLVAVVKYAGLDDVRALLDAGVRDFGESRPQQLWERADLLANAPLRWHLIGHLQRNKIRRTVPLVDLVHSGDSPRLLTALHEQSAELARRTGVLLEVNISGDASKHGLAPDDVEPLLSQLAQMAHLEVRGLMAMAARVGGRDHARRDFAALRELRERLKANCPPEIRLDELSMGMSDDFDMAVEEGATIVRVGSALFEGIES